MTFIWPELLWCLLAIPLCVAAYLWLLRRRRPAVRYAQLAWIRQAIGPGQSLRRHLPPALMLAAVAAGLIAAARPTATLTLPSDQQTIMLAVDVSLSMRAADVEPNRILAAQEAARAFIGEQPPNVRIGLVAFGGTASLVQAPTTDRDALIEAVNRFQLQRATATGSAIAVALATLFPDDGIDLQSMIFGRGFGSGAGPASGSGSDPRSPILPRAGGSGQSGTGAGAPATSPARVIQPVPPGSNDSAVIILLSDGRRTTGPDPIEVAKLAADRGVRIYTVGFGTLGGARVDFGEWSIYVRLDEETLKTVAQITRGEYFHAATAADLREVYRQLNSRFVLEKRETEISSLFAAAAVLLLACAVVLSLAWFGRPVRA